MNVVGASQSSTANLVRNGACYIIVSLCETRYETASILRSNFVLTLYYDSTEAPMIMPTDDYYTSPYGVVKVADNSGYLVFICYKTREAHDKAAKEMGSFAPGIYSCPNDFLGCMGFRKKDCKVFSKHSMNGPPKNIDDKAMKAVCEKFAWAIPEGWHQTRKELSETFRIAPIVDLLTWYSEAYF